MDTKTFTFPLLIVLGLVICIIKIFFFDLAFVDGNSMYPTLQNGDLLVVKKYVGSISKGDVVLLNLSITKSTKEYVVKRVIATGEDTVTIDYEKNRVYVNGQIIEEPYINYNQEDPMRMNGNPQETVFFIPNGYVFLLGDNRNYSSDSRDDRVGIVPTEKIIGTVSVLLPAEPG